MFPIRDDNPTLSTPLVTWAIVGLNVAAWVFLQGLGSDVPLARSVCTLGLIPGELTGALRPGTSIPLARGIACTVGGSSWLPVLSSMFMHGGWMHIIGNMWFLYVFGDNVEDAMGPVRFAVFYLLCGVAAAAVQVLANPASAVPMVGASGAIGGVMGAYIVLYPRVHVHMLVILGFYITTIAVPAVFMLGYWFLVQVLGGFGSMAGPGGGVAFWAHIGGFSAGAALVLVFRDRELLARHPYHGWRRPPLPNRSWRQI